MIFLQTCLPVPKRSLVEQLHRHCTAMPTFLQLPMPIVVVDEAMAVSLVGLAMGSMAAATYRLLGPSHRADQRHPFWERHLRLNHEDNHPYSKRQYTASGFTEGRIFRSHGDAVCKRQLDAPGGLEGQTKATPVEAARMYHEQEREWQARSEWSRRKHFTYH